MISITLVGSCKRDNSVSVIPANSSIKGTLKFIDNSPASFARVELKSNLSGRSILDTCDVDGKFLFSSITTGDYTIIFRSLSYDVNTSYVIVHVGENQDIIQDVLVRYNMLDDFSVKIISPEVFFIKFQPDGARIGNNYSAIKNLSGYYTANGIDSLTLSADVYFIPDNLDWTNPGVDLTVDYIKTNFQFLFSINEGQVTNKRHQINIYGSGIEDMFLNPAKGFAFVKRDSLAKVLKIPCVDFSNNDFGLKIYYN